MWIWGEWPNSPIVEASKQIPSWPCHEGLGRKITLGSFPMNCPTKQSMICCLHEDFSLDSVCYPFLLYFTGTDVFFLCNSFSSAPSPSFSLLAALIVDFYLQSHRGHLWCQQQCSCWENKANKKIQKSSSWPLSLQKKLWGQAAHELCELKVSIAVARASADDFACDFIPSAS